MRTLSSGRAPSQITQSEFSRSWIPFGDKSGYSYSLCGFKMEMVRDCHSFLYLWKTRTNKTTALEVICCGQGEFTASSWLFFSACNHDLSTITLSDIVHVKTLIYHSKSMSSQIFILMLNAQMSKTDEYFRLLWLCDTSVFFVCVCACVRGQWYTVPPWEHSSSFPLANGERGTRPVGWEEQWRESDCVRWATYGRALIEWNPLRDCKQEGNLKQEEFLIQSQWRTQLLFCLWEHHLLMLATYS